MITDLNGGGGGRGVEMFDLSGYVVISLSLIKYRRRDETGCEKKKRCKSFTYMPWVFAEIGKTIGPFIIM
jgi:hypothetical protein